MAECHASASDDVMSDEEDTSELPSAADARRCAQHSDAIKIRDTLKMSAATPMRQDERYDAAR